MRASQKLQPMPPDFARLTGYNKLLRLLSLFESTGIPIGGSAVRTVPQGAIYLNIGQLGLAAPFLHNWLGERPDLTCAVMLHDIIPIEFPQFVSAAAAGHHARMVRTTGRRADCLIFNSAAARDSVVPALEQTGCRDLPALVRWLPLPAPFEQSQSSCRPRDAQLFCCRL